MKKKKKTVIESTFDYWIEAEYDYWIVHFMNGLLTSLTVKISILFGDLLLSGDRYFRALAIFGGRYYGNFRVIIAAGRRKEAQGLTITIVILKFGTIEIKIKLLARLGLKFITELKS